MVNDLLQGKFKATLNDTGRFAAEHDARSRRATRSRAQSGLDKNDEDFGQTFGKWGVRPGPYIVLPFLGPSTLRDGSARCADVSTQSTEIRGQRRRPMRCLRRFR